jgi:hypothetical protein
VYAAALDATTDKHYQQLKRLRGLTLQTSKRHGLAWHEGLGCWLIPFKSRKGEVLNLICYDPATGTKLNLPAMETRLYGVDQLSDVKNRKVFVCEGPFDAIALDQHLRSKKVRRRYDIVAVPGAGVFKEKWGEFFRGRSVRLVYDNDQSGHDGQQRVAKFIGSAASEVLALEWPNGFPNKCDISDLVRDGVNIAEFTHEHCKKVAAGAKRIQFTRGDEIEEEKVDWLWEGRIPFGTFVSLSGLMGTHKSGIARDFVARTTAGIAMPNCTNALAAFDVLYFTSEDSASRVCDLVQVAGGDLSRLHVHDIARASEPIDILNYMDELEAEINSRGVRLVVLDALNSFVGGEITSDSMARRTLSGRLQALARRTGAAMIGIRNWGRISHGSSSQRSLGATSLSDVGRSVMNTRELEPKNGDRQFQLEFEKVSDGKPQNPIPYTVEDLSTESSDSHLRRIVWGKVAKKGSNRTRTHSVVQ